jgi:hypothetical protein
VSPLFVHNPISIISDTVDNIIKNKEDEVKKKNIDNLLKIFGNSNFSKTVLNEKESNILNYFKKLNFNTYLKSVFKQC